MSNEGTRCYFRMDGTTWPNPADPNDVEWALRYGKPSREDLLVAASFINAYKHLVSMTQRERNRRVTSLRLAAPASTGDSQPKDGAQ